MDGHSHPSASAFVRGAFEGGLEGHAIDVVARSVADSLGAARVLIVGRTAPGSVPYLIAAWERADAGVPPAWTRGTVTERAFESAAPVVVRERVDGTPAIGISEIAVTVRAREDSIGAIYASFSPPTAFDDDDIGWRLETYSRVAALCMAGDPALTGLLGASGVDALSGCLTYVGLREALRGEVNRSQRYGHEVACCFVELDGIERVNDERSHLEGNRVLAAVGAALRGEVRGYDTVGRFSGDEFVVILAGPDARVLSRAAGRLRDAARAAISAETSVGVGVSIGVAAWDRQQTPVELLDAADRALSDAKTNGNQVALASNGRRAGLFARTRERMGLARSS